MPELFRVAQLHNDLAFEFLLPNSYLAESDQLEHRQKEPYPLRAGALGERRLEADPVVAGVADPLQQLLLVNGGRCFIDLDEMIAEPREIDRCDDPLIGLKEIKDVGIIQLEHRLPGRVLQVPHAVRPHRVLAQECLPVLLERDRDGTRLLIELREGRNRQIRRMLQRLGHPVKKLRRIQLGPLKLKGLRPGQWRALTPRELRALKRAVAEKGKDSPQRARSAAEKNS